MKNENIIISICCITYNHENYICDAIEGFLKQKTTFPFEIIIHDDASTDKTPELIEEYVKKYPGLIIPIFQRENQYSKGVSPFINFVYPRTRGKYIAHCEGDDYWTDPYKLQKQIEFLDANEGYSICFHNIIILKGIELKGDYITWEVPDTTQICDLAQGNYIHTPSVVWRNGLINKFPEWISECPVSDYVGHLLLAQFGKIKKLNDTMAVYRIHNNGIWSEKPYHEKLLKWIKMQELLLTKFNPDVNTIIKEAQTTKIIELYKIYINLGKKENEIDTLFNEICTNPRLIIKYYEEKIFKFHQSRVNRLGRLILFPFKKIFIYFGHFVKYLKKITIQQLNNLFSY